MFSFATVSLFSSLELFPVQFCEMMTEVDSRHGKGLVGWQEGKKVKPVRGKPKPNLRRLSVRKLGNEEKKPQSSDTQGVQ